MNYESPRHPRTLSRKEIFDLARAGLVLALTVGLALIVPPKVFGAIAGHSDVPKIEATK